MFLLQICNFIVISREKVNFELKLLEEEVGDLNYFFLPKCPYNIVN